MNPIIDDNREELLKLCGKYRVKRLDLFGSATGDNFDPETSDLDFLVTFKELKRGEYADTYFGMLEALRGLFNRDIDLVMESAIKNPYFREAVEETRTLLYAA
ncbi:MAG: nucleotidyltransferase domain-containing protein [Chloroflexi bacterium]|nr:nucleotidyltransferase domain-containing protein [Chloroflexota bacterium]